MDRLEHRQSLLAAVRGPHEALVDERAEPIDDVHPGQGVDADADLFDVLDPRRREHGQDLEQRPLVVVEQLVAPGDRGAERPLAVGQVARSAPKDIESSSEAVAQLRRREQAKPRGRELDRERQPVESRADLADDRSRVVVEAEAWPRLSSALDEEGDRGGGHRAGGAAWQRERRHGQELLAADPQCLAARHQECELRTLPDQLRGVVGCRHHLLEVVEHEEEPARPEMRSERHAQVVIAGDREAGRLGDRDEDGGRFAGVREIDEEDAVVVVLQGVRRGLDAPVVSCRSRRGR